MPLDGLAGKFKIAAAFLLALLSIRDIRKREISLFDVLVFIGLGLISRLYSGFCPDAAGFSETILCLLPGGIVLAAERLFHIGIGEGDGLILLGLGLLYGFWGTVRLLLTALLLSNIPAAVLFLITRSGKNRLPFLPFLLAACCLELIS
jgi:Flp pilus assembly protein protease CpaA